jgi:hypothetical protein
MEVHRQRPCGIEEFAPVLASAGLERVHLFSWFDKSHISSKTEKIFCIAEKLSVNSKEVDTFL